MKKTLLLFALVLSVQIGFAQKGQTIAYFDMEYILENVPEYQDAQNNLNSKIEQWKSRLTKLERHIEVLKTDLTNEKAILTNDLIEEREEDITIKVEGTKELVLQISDNGKGFVLADYIDAMEHNGLKNMQFRAESFNGKCYIDSSKDNGTSIRVVLPLNAL